MRIPFAIVIAAALVMSAAATTATAKTVGSPPVQFVGASLTGGTANGVAQSGGTLTLSRIVYVSYPRGQELPANVPGLPANW